LYEYYFDQYIYAIARKDRIIHLLQITHELKDLMIRKYFKSPCSLHTS